MTGIIIGVLLLVNIIILSLTKYLGLDISSKDDFLDWMSADGQLGYLKGIIGANHLLTFVVGPLIFLSIFYKNRILEFLQLRHFDPQYILLFPLALFSLYPLMGYLTYYIALIDFPDYLSDLDTDATASLTRLLKMEGPFDLILNIILLGILPGVGEELLFRGIIQKEIHQKWNRPHLAIWVTAIIFSAFHFQVIGFLPKMMIGVVLGYAYFLSGSLILPMVIHALNNSFATVSYYFMGQNAVAENTPEANLPLGMVLISTLVNAALFYQIYQISSFPKNKIDE